MIRFIDLTDSNEGIPICAFLSTTSDMFLSNRDGSDIFSTLKEIEEHKFSNRLLSLVPKRFFEGKPKENKYRFHWWDGEIDEGYGQNITDAFTRLGYGAGTMSALDYFEEI